MSINQWSKTAGNNTDAVPNGAPENWTGSQVNNWAREAMAKIRTWYDAPEWLEITYELATRGAKTLVRSSATEIVIQACDATTYFTAGRQIKIVGATTDTGVVVSSALDVADTDVTVTMLGGDVPTAPTAIYVFMSTHVGDAAFKDQGAGNGLDADTVDGFEAADLAATRNFVLNGDFHVWQRGTSFTPSASTDTYTSDRWVYNAQDGAATVTREDHTLGQTDVPSEPHHYFKVVQANASTQPYLEQRIEGVRTLAGKQVTVSWYAKDETDSYNLDTEIDQNFGTGGSPSTTVTTSGTTAAVTSSWARFTHTITIPSISGKTLGTDGNDYLAIRINLPAADQCDLYISDVQVETGSTASNFVREAFQTVYEKCLRYYQKTFPYATAPAQAAGFAGSLSVLATDGTKAGGQGLVGEWQLPTLMRSGGADMTVTTYNPTQANADWRKDDDAADVTVSSIATDEKEERAVVVQAAAAAAFANKAHRIHLAADAEL